MRAEVPIVVVPRTSELERALPSLQTLLHTCYRLRTPEKPNGLSLSAIIRRAQGVMGANPFGQPIPITRGAHGKAGKYDGWKILPEWELAVPPAKSAELEDPEKWLAPEGFPGHKERTSRMGGWRTESARLLRAQFSPEASWLFLCTLRELAALSKSLLGVSADSDVILGMTQVGLYDEVVAPVAGAIMKISQLLYVAADPQRDPNAAWLRARQRLEERAGPDVFFANIVASAARNAIARLDRRQEGGRFVVRGAGPARELIEKLDHHFEWPWKLQDGTPLLIKSDEQRRAALALLVGQALYRAGVLRKSKSAPKLPPELAPIGRKGSSTPAQLLAASALFRGVALRFDRAATRALPPVLAKLTGPLPEPLDLATGAALARHIATVSALREEMVLRDLAALARREHWISWLTRVTTWMADDTTRLPTVMAEFSSTKPRYKRSITPRRRR